MDHYDNIVSISDGEISTYIMSMENIDLSLLPMWRGRDRSETVPLWSARSSEYFEFQVVAEEITERGDAERENAHTLRCEVCDVAVPCAYLDEHARSDRHRACALVARTAVQRAGRQMSLDVPAAQTAKSPLTYHCEHCCIAVDKSESSSHEKTEQHSQSILHTKLLKSLSFLYANNNDLNKVFKEIYGDIVQNIKLSEVEDTKKDNKKEVNVNANINSTKVEDYDTKPDNIKTQSERSNIKAEVVSENIKEDPDHAPPILVIHPKSGAKLRVSFDNYHGFYKVDGKILCRVCRLMVAFKNEHHMDLAHKKKVEVDIKDKHCIRQLNQILNHCILCNEIFENPEAHILCSEQHNKLLAEALIADDRVQSTEDSYTKEVLAENLIENVTNDNQSYYCKVCQVYIMKSTLLDHVNVDGHKKSLQSVEFCSRKVRKFLKNNVDLQSLNGYCGICNIQIKGKKAEKVHLRGKEHRYREWLSEKDTKVHYHMKQTEEASRVVICQICDVRLSDRIDIVNYHVNSEKHQTKYKKVLEDNYMEQTSNIHVLCSICKLTLYMIDDVRHILSKCHAKKKALYEILGVTFMDLKEINQTLKRLGDTAKLRELLKANRVENYDLKNYLCKHCNKRIQKTAVLDHISNKRHRKSFMGDTRLQITNSLKHTVPDEFDDTDNSSESENEAQIPHFAAEQAVVKSEIKKDEKEECTESTDNELTQVNDNNELVKLNTTNCIETTQCDRIIEPPKFTLLKSKKKLHYLFELANTNNDDEVICLVCKVLLPFNVVTAHQKNIKHTECYANLLESNTMFRIRHRCFCECCQEILKINNEYIHLAGECHRSNLTRNSVRMDKGILKELSLKMFNEDIADEKAAKRLDRFARISTNKGALDDSDDGGEFRFENLKTLLFLDSSNDLRIDSDEEDNSVSDSSDIFVSAKSNEENQNDTFVTAKSNAENQNPNLERWQTQDIEIETTKHFTESIAHLFEETNTASDLLCKICHYLVPNHSDLILEHIDGVKHIKKYEAVLLQNGLKEKMNDLTETINKYYCKFCGIDVEKSELFVHIKSNKHKLYFTTQPSTSGSVQQTEIKRNDTVARKSNLSQKINCGNNQTNPIIVLNEEEQILLSHKHFLMAKINKDELYCKICSAEISDAALKTHVNSCSHQSNIEALLTENEVKMVGVQMFCELCKISLAEGTEIKHVYGQQHKLNFKDSSVPLAKKICTLKANKGYVCTTCNIEIINNPNIIKFHNESVRHKSNTLKTSKTTHVDNQTESNARSRNPISNANVSVNYANHSYYCKTCKVQVPNNPNNIKMHVDGEPHKNKLKHAENSKPPIPVMTTGNLPNSSTPVLNFNYVEKGFCNVCKVKIPENMNNIREHLKGKIHNDNVKVLKSKTIKNIPSQNLNQNKTKLYNSMPDISLNTEINNKEIIKKNSHCENVIKLESCSIVKNNATSSQTVFNYVINGYCHACQAKVPHNIHNIEEHVKGNIHCENVKKLESCKLRNSTSIPILNSIVTGVSNGISDGFCHICKVEIPTNIENVNQHIKGRIHEMNVQIFNSKITSNTLQKDQEVNSKGNSSATSPDIDWSGVVIPGGVFNSVKNGFCDVCKTNVSQNVNNIQQHIGGKAHNQNMLESITKMNENMPSYVQQTKIKAQNIASYAEVLTSVAKSNINPTSLTVTSENNKRKRVRMRKNKTKVGSSAPITKADNGNCNSYEEVSATNNVILYNAEAHVSGNSKPDHAICVNSKGTHTYSSDDDYVNRGANETGSSLCGEVKVKIIDTKISSDLIETDDVKTEINKETTSKSKINNIDAANSCDSDSSSTNCKNSITDTNKNEDIHTDTYQDTITFYYDSDVDFPESDTSYSNNTNTNEITCVTDNRNLNIGQSGYIDRESTDINQSSTSYTPENSETDYFDNMSRITIEETVPSGERPLPKSDNNDANHHSLTDIASDDEDNDDKKAYVNTATIEKTSETDKSNFDDAESSSSDSGRNEGENSETNQESNTSHEPENTNTGSYGNINTDCMGTNIKTVQSSESVIAKTVTFNTIIENDDANNHTLIDAAINENTYNKSDASDSSRSDEANQAAEQKSGASCFTAKTNTVSSDGVFIRAIKLPTLSDESTVIPSVTFHATSENNEANTATDAAADDEDEGFYICKDCGRCVANHPIDINSHLVSFHHLTKVNERKTKEKEGLLPITAGHYCGVCKTEVPRNSIAIKSHSKTNRHIERFEDILVINKIKIRDDRICYCEVCDLYFSKFSAVPHIARASHVMKLC